MNMPNLALLSIIFFATPALANQNPPRWVTEGPNLESTPASFEIPIEVVAMKLYVEIEVGGKPRRFVFDTGSPSMIDTALVDELGLEAIGTNRGVDSHGAVVETEIVQVDIDMGGIAIKKVPMMAADFSASVPTKLFIGDGVLGSDLFPLGAWQFDLDESVLRFNTRPKALPHVKKSRKLKLYQFGYPYMPLFDVRFAKEARSKAMFDTGSPALFTISAQDFGGASKASGVGRTQTGYGSPGASLGGQASEAELLRLELDSLSIDALKLGRVVAMRRALSPSLIGARLLENYVVTLDSRSESAYFSRYSDELTTAMSFGFSLAFDNTISVGAVWEGSPAEAAGLQAGMQLISINGTEVEFTEEGLLRAINAMDGQDIEMTWKGGTVNLTKQPLFPLHGDP